MLAAIVSALHLTSLALALTAVFSRGVALRALVTGDRSALGRVLSADNVWGITALLSLATGLFRLFGGLDKEADFYLYNGFFWLKMGLFALVLVLEIRPMITFIRWRMALMRGGEPDTRGIPLLLRINNAEILLVLLIPFAAAAMHSSASNCSASCVGRASESSGEPGTSRT